MVSAQHKILAVLINLVFFQCTISAVDNEVIDRKLDDMMKRFQQLEHKSTLMLRRLELLDRKESCTRLAPMRDYSETTATSRTATQTSATDTTSQLCGTSGVVTINYGKTPFPVLCDRNRWLVILQRFDGSVRFHDRDWQTYKKGFGEVSASREFFLGLEHVHELTAAGRFELFFEMEDYDGVRAWAQYSSFSLGDEQSAYQLGALREYSGTAGDSFSYHEGQGFTSLDRDNDAKAIGSCGEEFNSAGWFKSCMEANVLGRYLPANHEHFKEGVYWETFGGPDTSLKSLKMMMRARR